VKLLDDEELEKSAIVANCRMNRERNLLGSNGYNRELGFDPIAFLQEKTSTGGTAAWLDLCCGTGRALIQAAEIVLAEQRAIDIVGVDLVGMVDPTPPDLPRLRLVEASLSTWRPERAFDLITCVHGLHYVGDKLGLIACVASWLVEDGLFVASLDLHNVKSNDDSSARRITSALRRTGLLFDNRRRLISCRGRRQVSLPFRYAGADDTAGPNYTGQPAVDSFYEVVEDTRQ
jgi:SAM-dependent methyltransferase